MIQALNILPPSPLSPRKSRAILFPSPGNTVNLPAVGRRCGGSRAGDWEPRPGPGIFTRQVVYA